MSQFHSIKVSEINKETSDSVSISFDIPENLKSDFQFIPGQYLTLKMIINGEDCRRSYSICSSFDESLSVAVKKVPNGKMSTFLNESLNVGDEIDIMPPQGNFQLNPDPKNTRKFVGFAAGSGITPIMSMIKQLEIDEPESEFLLFYSNKTEKDTIFKDQFDQLKTDRIKVQYIYTRQKTKGFFAKKSSSLYEGRIDQDKANELLKANISWVNSDAFYLCGPEEMIFSVKNAIESLGVIKDKVKFELFTSPVKLAEQQSDSVEKDNDIVDGGFEGEATVTVICDDEEVEFTLDKDGDTILDAAMDEDLDVPFSCKGAVCCTCKAKVVEGKVTMDANYALSEEEVAEGFVLACQAHPASAKVIVDFD
jgi:ring-1,2-phenylacetyl-CoA epoxidase subunit PaaE